MEQQFMATQEANSPNITNDSELNREGTGPASEESESHQEMTVPAKELFPGSSGDLALEVQQVKVLCTDLNVEQQPMATQNANMPNITNDNELPRGYNEPAGEESESDDWEIVSETEHFTGPSGVKVHMLVAGETFQTHETFMQKLELQIELCSAESSNVILVFCPVVSRIGTDMEAAMAKVTEDKPVILVFMHHCHDPSHMTNITVQLPSSSKVQVIHCAFHETKGLLECQENEQAIAEVQSALLSMERTKPLGEESKSGQWRIVSPMENPTGLCGVLYYVRELLFNLKSSVYSWLYRNPSVKVHMLVNGETFGTHETFMQKLKLQIEQDNTENSNVILVFCPVVSQTGTDMDAAIDTVPENKPVILVFMHHCHNPSHMTNIAAQPSRGNIVQVVHCAFHERNGLLECQENEQAVDAVRSTLLRCVDLHAEVPQSSTKSDIEQQPVAAQDDITHDSEPQSTEPVGERSDSGGSCRVKVDMVLSGETFKTHVTFIQKLKLRLDVCSAKSSNVILVFCTVVSRIGTDMEAAMARVTEDKPVILVFMHHCHDPSHMTNITIQPSRSNIVQVVHCAFHESRGLLLCQENEQAVAKVEATLKKYK